MDDFTVVLIVVIAVPFLLFIIRITILCWHNIELSRQIHFLEQQQAALQQVQSPYVSSTSDNNNSNSNNTTISAVKEFDLPPTYEDVVQIYTLNRQQQSSAENVPVGNATDAATTPTSSTLSAAISTLTVATDISNSNNSIAVNVKNHSTTQ